MYKFIGDLEEYYDNLNNALENPFTLSYSKSALKKELEYAAAQLGKQEDIEPERTVEEYDSDEDGYDEFDEEESDSDEEYDEEDSSEEDDEEYQELEDENSNEQYEEIPDYKGDEE